MEGYNRQLRKVRRTKGAFPSVEAARKLLFLVTRDSTWTWAAPVHNWTRIFESIRDPRAVALRELGRIERTLLAPKTVADVVDERWA